MENIYFSVVDESGETTHRINFDYDDVGGHDGVPAQPVKVTIEGTGPMTIDAQQMMELGSLFLALAGQEVDFDSADGLLESFNLKGRAVATKLADALVE